MFLYSDANFVFRSLYNLNSKYIISKKEINNKHQKNKKILRDKF